MAQDGIAGWGTRRRSMGWLLATVCVLMAGFAGPALGATGSIDGAPLNVAADDGGRLQVDFDGASTGEFYSPTKGTPANAGFNLSTGGTLYGYLGTGDLTPVSGPTLLEDPFRLVTTYMAGSTLEVQQTITYVDGSREIELSYEVKNVSEDPVFFRATVSADVYYGGSDVGVGVPVSGTSPNRQFGGRNANGQGLLLERDQSPWSAFEEDRYTTVDAAVVSGSLDNSVNTTSEDNGMAVQWSNHLGSPLAAGQTATYDVGWRFSRRLGLTPGNAERPIGEQHTVSATLTDYDGLFSGARSLRYRILGSNPTTGPQSVDTDAQTGQAVISWTGQNPGFDTLQVWADLDNDSIEDPEEPSEEASINWRGPELHLNPSAAAADIGGTHVMDVSGLAADGEPLGGALVRYTISRDEVPGEPRTIRLDANGEAAIELTNTGEQTTLVSAFADLNDENNVQDGDEPGADASVEWAELLALDPPDAARTTGETHTVTATVGDPPSSGKGLREEPGVLGCSPNPCGSSEHRLLWSVAGANPGSGEVIPDAESLSARISWSGANPGRDTLEVHDDYDGNGERDQGEPVERATVDWNAPPTTPPAPPPGPPSLTLDPPSAERDGGQAHTVKATLTGPDGSPQAASVLRGAVEGANARSLGSQTTGADGAAQFTYTGLSGGLDTVRVFADLDGNGTRGVDEPEAVATVRWMTAAPPKIGETANVEPVRGEVLVAVPEDTVLARRLLRSDAAEIAQSSPGSGFTNFVRIQDVTHVPVGSILETVRGAARLTTARNARGATQMGTFDGGQFRMTQDEGSPIVDLSLRGGLSERQVCGRRRSGPTRPGRAVPAAEAHSARRVLRRLRGNARGRYRTRGRRSSATVRGTVWSMEERCDGTLTRVRSGVVSVRDFAKRRTITLRRGRSYLARPRARRR